MTSNDNPIVSVALCTYNGAQHIEEQLQSILQQTRQPDQIVVCDDRSTDGTLAIVSAILGASSVRYRIECNNATLGSTGNFGRAIGLCDGDVIFLADQDDYWEPDKIQRTLAAFDRSPAIAVVISDAAIVGPALEPTGRTMFQALRLSRVERKRIVSGRDESVLVRPFVTGATLALRRCLVPFVLPIPSHRHMIHDRWIAVVAAAYGRIAIIDRPLVRYRQHAGQQVGAPDKWKSLEKSDANSVGSHAAQLGYYRDLSNLLVERGVPIRSRFRKTLEDAIQHLEVRTHLPESRLKRLPKIARELADKGYNRFSSGFRSAVKDMLYG